MKRALVLLFSIALALTGCEYEVPLTESHEIPIDPKVLGTWEEKRDRSEGDTPPDRMVVLQFSPTEYVVHYGEKYFRAYPVRVDGADYVQLQWLGTPKEEGKEVARFHVLSYRLDGETLEMKTLNSEVVSNEIRTSSELAKKLVAEKSNPQLFHEPGKFVRVKSDP